MISERNFMISERNFMISERNFMISVRNFIISERNRMISDKKSKMKIFILKLADLHHYPTAKQKPITNEHTQQVEANGLTSAW